MGTPPGNIQILLPVWGERYTSDFLELCLPSLLAPGNLPRLSTFGQCTFVLLAPARDAEVIKKSSLWALLQTCCAVRIQHIDDLISQSSSTVLTLAYARAIRETGVRARDTCFLFLVADYVVSDGSLSAVVKCIFAGASGVLAGNFQIARDVAFPCLEEKKNDARVLAIPSRTLVDLSLKALHPATLANIVHEGQLLKGETNRLFWRVDDHCMVGRFFLMHMIAIRPETSDFIIAAPSDYSLIPELCPSGNVVHITDSDDYFVVECQPYDFDLQKTAAEYVEPRSVANALAPWATAIHRDNARHAVVFHTGMPSAHLTDTIADSEMFVAKVGASCVALAPAMPFRHHPIWARALDYHLTTAQIEPDLMDLVAITGDFSLAGGLGRLSRLRSIVLGRAPHFRPWHPRSPDVRTLVRSLAAASGNVAIVSNASARVRVWLDMVADGQRKRTTTHIRIQDVLFEPSSRGEQPGAWFDCLFLIMDEVPTNLAAVFPRITSLLKSGGVIVLAFGGIFSEADMTSIAMPNELVQADRRLTLEKTTRVAKGAWRTAIQVTMMRYARRSTGSNSWLAAYWLAAAGGLAPISMFFNFMAARERSPEKQSPFSSLFFTFRNAESGHNELSVQDRTRTVGNIEAGGSRLDNFKSVAFVASTFMVSKRK